MYTVNCWINDYTAFIITEDDLSVGDEITVESREFDDESLVNRIRILFGLKCMYHNDRESATGVVLDSSIDSYTVELKNYPSVGEM